MAKTYMTYCRRCGKETEHYLSNHACVQCKKEHMREYRKDWQRTHEFQTYMTFCHRCNKETKHYSSNHACVYCQKELNSRGFNQSLGHHGGWHYVLQWHINSKGNIASFNITMDTNKERKQWQSYKNIKQKRQRDMGWYPIIPIPKGFEGHHINDQVVVPMPRWIHNPQNPHHQNGVDDRLEFWLNYLCQYALPGAKEENEL
jgi:hypothetical protein